MWDTLIGGLLVIAGGALSFVGNYWMESRRWKREDKYRDYADRQRVYAEYTTSWSSYEEVKNTRLGDEAGRQALEQAHLQLLRSFNTLALLAPEEVRAAALALRDWSESNPEDRDPAVPGRFWKAVQKDLGKWPPR